MFRKFFIVTFLILSFVMGCKVADKKENRKSSLLINHLGYQQDSEKKVVLQTSSETATGNFEVVDESGNTVFESTFERGGKIDNWHTGNAYAGFFTSLRKKGSYYVVAIVEGDTVKSEPFLIRTMGFVEECIPLLLDGFQHERCKAPYDEKDKQISFFGDRDNIVDVHGGWYDASGEKGKYLSHLFFSNFMTPQQTPMVVWNMLESSERIANSANNELIMRLKNEAVYGADFLVRMQDNEGYFYTIVFANWSSVAEKREICAYEGIDGKRTADYQAAFREGAGVAIAALARISKTGLTGDYQPDKYLGTAEKGYRHLLKNNRKYVDDGKENIIDAYCALLATTELYGATTEKYYLIEAEKWMTKLISYQKTDENYSDWWSANDDGTRPFFHGAEAGLPIIALCRYLDFEKKGESRQKAIDAIQKAVDFQLRITNEVNNPFGYPRQYVKAVDSIKQVRFFLPHKNETGYWWQGENARIASLSSAFQIAMPYLSDSIKVMAKSFALNQVNWILGLNPYDAGMLEGVGRNNPDYNVEGKSYNYKGGVCNGITAGFDDESDIAFMPLPQNNDPAQNWRWSEQWIPHAAWLMLTVATIK